MKWLISTFEVFIAKDTITIANILILCVSDLPYIYQDLCSNIINTTIQHESNK
jgi:hypothetical protein